MCGKPYDDVDKNWNKLKCVIFTTNFKSKMCDVSHWIIYLMGILQIVFESNFFNQTVFPCTFTRLSKNSQKSHISLYVFEFLSTSS